MSWSENTLSRCNNPSCAEQIYWNSLVTHPVTKRPRPLNSPYFPDNNPTPDLHQCMKAKPPKEFINKYAKYDHTIYYTAEDVEKMKDPVIKAEWQKGVQDWLDKWEGLNR